MDTFVLLALGVGGGEFFIGLATLMNFMNKPEEFVIDRRLFYLREDKQKLINDLQSLKERQLVLIRKIEYFSEQNKLEYINRLRRIGNLLFYSVRIIYSLLYKNNS